MRLEPTPPGRGHADSARDGGYGAGSRRIAAKDPYRPGRASIRAEATSPAVRNADTPEDPSASRGARRSPVRRLRQS
ncbi:MAG: hypothetical protein GY719_03590 [bacterium]|nr:hypothetical protein [bacterium]